jgi:hypothetical protein
MIDKAKKIILPFSAALLTGVFLIGCSGAPEEKFTAITLDGRVRMIAGPVPAGTIHFRLYNLEAGSGDLAHPLAEIEDFESDSAEFTHTFEYPLHKGEGIALHAWLDADGDGIFCTPDSRTDPSGMSWNGETPEGTIELSVLLSDNCRAASWFYPPKP